MKINWKDRVKNPHFWLQVSLAILMPILSYFGLTADDLTTWAKVGQLLLEAVSSPHVLMLVLVSLYNAIQDPTSKGIGDSVELLQSASSDKGAL